VTSTLCVSIFKHGQSEFLSLLRDNNIEYNPRPPMPGQVIDAPDLYDISILVVNLVALAVSILQWKSGRASRHVQIQVDQRTLVDVKDDTPEKQVVEYLKITERVRVFQTTEDDNESTGQ
jgi:hypothetical protein